MYKNDNFTYELPLRKKKIIKNQPIHLCKWEKVDIVAAEVLYIMTIVIF